MSVQFSPDGTKIVSGGYSGTIKVWDAGVLAAQNRPSLAKSDASCLPTQPCWISRRRRRMRTAIRSHRSSFRPTERRSYPALGTRRSKSGTQVCFGPQIALPWPKLTVSAFPCSHAGAEEREDQRPRPLHQLGGVFPGWSQDCLCLQWRDDQSLGCRCVLGPKLTLPRPKLTPAGLPGSYAGSQG